MKENCKEFIFVIGKSEGMDAEKMIEGINKIVDTQKKGNDESIFTLAFFNEVCKISASGKSFKEMKKYNKITYVPKGKSALWDAMGYSMDSVGERLSETSDENMPCQVCMIVIGENDSASTVYDFDRIAEMVKVQKYTYKWDFVFYGDGESGFDINKGGKMDDYDKMFEAINNYITSLR